MKNFIIIFTYICLVQLIIPRSAHAYIDPGVGSMALQALAAGALGIAVFWGRCVSLVKAVFRKKNSVDEAKAEDDL